MNDSMVLSSQELLSLEERQLHHFLTHVRPVGEEKSELYPEPQYFNVAFISVAAQLPGTIEKIVLRTGGTKSYAARLRRVLSPATALHMSGLSFIATWGREMFLLEDPGANIRGGVITPSGALTLSDDDVAHVLRFSYDVVRKYRCDGEAYPNATGALGRDYRILGAPEAEAIAEATSPAGFAETREVLGLLAAVRAISFLMEAETREALMMHGPYPVGGQGDQLILFECTDLRWALFPNFPLSGGARWSLPERPFPTANLAIALVVRGTQITADRFGTLYLDPFGPENVVSASLLTRGSNAFVDEGLSRIPLSEAKALRLLCDEIQEFMFLQIAGWDVRQRMEAGIYQEHMLLLRVLSAAGFSLAELEAEQRRTFELAKPIVERFFETCLARPTEQLPFYQRLGAFAGGSASALFTPFTTGRY